MLEIKGVTKVFGGEKVAVNNLSLSILPNRINGFLGPNGAGKTTLIKMITGILNIDEGDITLFGKSITKEAVEVKRMIGYVNDSGVLYEKLTGREFVDFMADIYGVSKDERKERADKLLQTFHLTEAFDNQISSYSHGMKQKMSIIGALVHNPKLLILDEPMVGLDPQSAFELKEIMRNHADEGNIVFFSTHVLDVAEKICDQISIIDNGNLIVNGSIEEIQEIANDKSLEEFFLSIAHTSEEI